jgi:membrane-bound ClpP family serine protease
MSTLAWPLLLLAFGFLLLIAEVFIPSGGLIGVLALCCLGLSLWRAFQVSTNVGMMFLLADGVLLPVTMALAIHLWPRTPLARRVFLARPTPEEIEVSHPIRRLDHLVGQFGRALTPLRPSGLVDFDGRRLDGLSEEGLIPPGALIRAVRVRGGQLVVRTASPPLDPLRGPADRPGDQAGSGTRAEAGPNVTNPS